MCAANPQCIKPRKKHERRKMKSIPLSRRDFLRFLGLGSAGLLTSGSLVSLLSSCTPQGEGSIALATATLPITETPTLAVESASGIEPDVEIALRAGTAQVPILPGSSTKVWQYQGEVLKGAPEALQDLPNTYLGPAFHLKKGQNVRVHFTNELPEVSIVHWHGLHVPEAADGHPRLAINTGETYVYDFQVSNRAGTYWYHPHPHGRTGPQVYYGLAGLFIVSDEEGVSRGSDSGERTAGLYPAGCHAPISSAVTQWFQLPDL
jgi:FtsP/CotA-like multicopper oxidase with cupredoxin domain